MERIEAAIEARNTEVRERMKAAHVCAASIAKKMRLVFHGGVAVDKLTSGSVYGGGDVPDIDVFTSKGNSSKRTAHAMAHLMRREGVQGVRLIPAIHQNTHSIRIDRGVVADVTWIPQDALAALRYWSSKEGAPPGIAPSVYLKMSMHLELCRPAVYIERWRKVWPRLSALYQRFPRCVPSGIEAKTDTSIEEQIDVRGEAGIIASASALGMPIAGRHAVLALTGSDIMKEWPMDIVIPASGPDAERALGELCAECGLEVVAGLTAKNPFAPQYRRLTKDGDYIARAHVMSTEVCTGGDYGSSDLVLYLLYGEFLRTPGPYGSTHLRLAEAIDAVVASQTEHAGEEGVHARFAPFNRVPRRVAKPDHPVQKAGRRRGGESTEAG